MMIFTYLIIRLVIEWVDHLIGLHSAHIKLVLFRIFLSEVMLVSGVASFRWEFEAVLIGFDIAADLG